ncbi:MAG: ATP-binding protein [Candidatus Cybelea sp.]
MRRQWRFDPCASEAADRVRSEIRQALETHEREDAIVRLDIIYAEIVSNAVRHAPGVLEVRVECGARGGDVTLHVMDRGPGYRVNPRLPSDLFSETGRGLFIISMHADHFTVERRHGGGSHARIVLRALSVV